MTFGGHAEKVRIVFPLKRELDFEGPGGSAFRRFWGLFQRPRSRHLSRGTFGDFVRFWVDFGALFGHLFREKGVSSGGSVFWDDF